MPDARSIGLDAWRDRADPSDPNSPPNRTAKADARAYINANADEMETARILATNAHVGFPTYAGMTGNLAYPANTVAENYDSDPTKAGIYIKSGGSGAGSWGTRVRPLSDVAIATDLAEAEDRIDELEAEFDAALPISIAVYDGDSNTDYSDVAPADGSYIWTNARGIMTATHAICPRFNNDVFIDLAQATFVNGANLAKAADTSANILTRRPRAIAQVPDLVILFGPTNDVTGGVSAATSLANMESYAQPFIDAQIPVIFTTIPPMGPVALPYADPKRIQQAAYRTGILAFAADKPRVFVVDVQTILDDGTGKTGGAPLTGTVEPAPDEKHILPLGAYMVAPHMAAVIRQIVPDRKAYPSFGRNNRFPNPTLRDDTALANGTTGAGVTGAVADGCNVWRASGTACTAVASLEDNPDTGGKSQVLTITRGGAAAFEYFEFRVLGDVIDVSDLIGKPIRIWAEIEAVGSCIRNIQVLAETGVPRTVANRPFSLSTDDMGVLNGTFLWLSPQYVLQSGQTTLGPKIYITVNPGGTGSAVVKIKRVWIGPANDGRIRRGLV